MATLRVGELDIPFDIRTLEGFGYADVPADADGWRESPTWGRSFRLRRLVNPAGLPEFRLDVRPS